MNQCLIFDMIIKLIEVYFVLYFLSGIPKMLSFLQPPHYNFLFSPVITGRLKYSESPLSMVSLSMVSVACGQL
jgi:hypothetical protein